MSYILNALRKSEQERRNKEPETLQHRIAEIPPPADAKTPGLIAALIVINVLLLGYFALDHYRRVPGSTVPVEASIEPRTVEVIKVKPENAADKDIKVEPEPVFEASSGQQPSPGSGNQIKVDPKPVAKAEKKPVETPPVITDKGSPQPTLPKTGNASGPVGGDVQSRAPAYNSAASERPSESTRGQVKKDADPNIKPSETSPIPYLDELPYEFRQRIPSFNINVFVYSEQVAGSFVMIDMEKYKVGQRIKGALELKEIRPDSLVVRYDDRIFQIKRP